MQKLQPFVPSLATPAGRGTARRMLLSASAAALVAACVWLLPGLRLLEERSRDALTLLAASNEPVAGVIVIDIGEESLESLGMWPWSRSQLADLVEELVGPLGARGVALDMVLPEAADAAGDARLASLAMHAPLTLAHVLDFADRPASITVGALAGGKPAAMAPPSVAQARGYVANHAGLRGARCVGHIGVRPDADGILRRVHVQALAAQRLYSTLSLALLECAAPVAAQRAVAGLGPMDGGEWRLPFRQPVTAFETLPAQAVLKDGVDPAQVRGRLVLIGSSAVGLSDYVATPLQPVTAGVLVHAQMLAELLEAERNPAGGWRTSAPALSVAALAAGALLLGMALRAGVRIGLAALLVLVAGWLALCAIGFGRGWSPAVLPPVLGLYAFAVTWVALDFIEARRVSRRIMNTLSHYVAEPVLKLLVRQGLERTLAPSRQEITVLVADMAGYTKLTAESSLEASASLTTEFLEAITGPVLGSGATLDRYTGDGLIAFWGAPLARKDHAACAVQAAWKMLEAVKALNEARAARGAVPLAMRIGIESGEALVGDLGSSVRSVYTAVGTCINLASRLQEVARDIGEVVVVGPQAHSMLAGQPLRPLGATAVRGMDHPIDIYALKLH
ncbi:MAG: adenylate/guanylate cyclase domain-containing protein [Ramlibacter sp.]|nr:adenylate/guanylate cyclase domain-containing protein [Ramlibacter sp.]